MKSPIQERLKTRAKRILPFMAGLLLVIPPLSVRAEEGAQEVSANAPAAFPGIVTPAPGTGASPSAKVKTAWFRHGKRLTLAASHPDLAVLGYVARRVFPAPGPLLSERIRTAVDRLRKSPELRVSGTKTVLNGQPVLLVSLDRETLNRLARQVYDAVQKAAVSERIRKVALSGVPPKDSPFVTKNLGVGPGSPVSDQPLSDNLYALSQLPGYARADALLLPTGLPGEEDLVVKTTPSSTLAGSQIEIDNYGYAPAGAVMLNGTLDINDALFAGDQGTVAASTSFFGMNSGTISYSAPLDLENRLGADMNALDYRLGLGFSPWGHGATVSQLVALGLSGSNYSFDGWGRHSFVQSSMASLALKGTVFLKEFQDTYSPVVQNDRSVTGGTVELSGARTAGTLSASIDIADTEYGLTQGSGSSAANPFYSDTQGLQNYWTGNGGLRVALSPVYAVYLSTADQQYIGGGALDPMLQAVLGGMSNVRALPTAALFGNDLYSGSLSFLRTDAVKGGSLVSSLFFDAGQVTGIGFQYGAMGPGIEEAWTGRHFFGKLDLAVPVGPLPTAALGNQVVALTGGNIQNGGIPLQLWLSAGWRY